MSYSNLRDICSDDETGEPNSVSPALTSPRNFEKLSGNYKWHRKRGPEMRRVKWGPRGWWDCLGDLCQGQCCWGEAEQEASSYDQLTEAFAEMSDYSSAPSAPQRLRYQF